MTDGAPERDDSPAPGPAPGVWPSRRAIGTWVAIGSLCAVIAVNLVVIVSALVSAGVPAPAPATALRFSVPSLAPTPSAQPEADSDGDPGAMAPGDIADTDEAEPAEREPEREPPKRSGTVYQAAARSCSTSAVDGLSRQIIAQARCIDASAFRPVPARKNLVTRPHVFLYLEASARDRLVRVLDAHPERVMKVNSALRTVAQQYLLWRWSAAKRCGIQLATPPGDSNHETGLALDISEPAKWRAALEAEDFHWLGTIDRVHFDYKGGLPTPHTSVDVMAFQQLWNKNHPDDTIAVSGRYGAETDERLKRSPAGGFAAGGGCDKARSGVSSRAAR